MKVDKKELEKSQLELIIELSVEELQPYLEESAKEISKHKKIEGFRPGKAPLKVVIQQTSEMLVYQTAANFAVESTLDKIITEQNIEVIDQPKIEIQKLAPNNPLIYKATIALVPSIEIADYSKIHVKLGEEIKINDKDIDKVIEDLRKMRAKDSLQDKTSETGDKLDLDFDTSIDNVPIDGGSAKKHQLIIGEGRMIPGFEDNLIGLKSGEEKEFELAFPKKYHAENLAGKKAKFKVKINGIYKVELPELNDEFGKSMGLTNLENLRNNISSNLRQEKETKEKQRIELEIIEKLIEASKFADLPETLIDQETHKMIHELQDNIARQGMNYEDYLKHIKKSESDLRLDFTPNAIKRVKTGLLIRAIAKKEEIKASEEEVNQEIERTIVTYKFNPQFADQIDELEKRMRTPEARQYFTNVITNRNTVEFLKDKILEKKEKTSTTEASKSTSEKKKEKTK